MMVTVVKMPSSGVLVSRGSWGGIHGSYPFISVLYTITTMRNSGITTLKACRNDRYKKTRNPSCIWAGISRHYDVSTCHAMPVLFENQAHG
jgi:hypothetical protein